MEVSGTYEYHRIWCDRYGIEKITVISSIEIEIEIVGVWLAIVIVLIFLIVLVSDFDKQAKYESDIIARILTIGKGYPFEINISTTFLQT